MVWASCLVWWKCLSTTCVTRWGVCPLPSTDRTKWILNCRPRIATLPPWMITGRDNGARQRNSLTPLVAHLTCSRSCLVCYLFSNTCTSFKSCFLFYCNVASSTVLNMILYCTSHTQSIVTCTRWLCVAVTNKQFRYIHGKVRHSGACLV